MKVLVSIAIACAACGGSDKAAPDAAEVSTDAPPGGRWLPHPGTTWQWQLSGTLDTTVDADVYDIDLFDNDATAIDGLHRMDRKVICYFDTAYEPGRPDSSKLDKYRGDPIDGFPGQYWLDIRVKAVQDVMVQRIQMAAAKQCDAIEPDDVDVTTNDTTLGITPAEQLAFIQLLVTEGQKRQLAVALKNDLDQVPALVDLVDFAINEQCFMYAECDGLTPFINENKAVFQTEYTDGDLAAKGATVCPDANTRNFDTLIKHLELGPERFACR